jgi:hypothetical protein
MRIDPQEIFGHALAVTPLRFGLAWLSGTIGAAAPIGLFGGDLAIDDFGWGLLFLPFYLLIMAITSGWWSFIAGPLLIVLAWRIILFMRNDNSGSDLVGIFTLSYLIGIRGAGSDWPIGLVFGAFFIYMTFQVDREKHLDDPH